MNGNSLIICATGSSCGVIGQYRLCDTFVIGQCGSCDMMSYQDTPNLTPK